MTWGFGVAALLVLAAGTPEWAAGSNVDHALAVAREVERIARQAVLWPGFDPIGIPLAIFTDEGTYLFRHPAPPDGFFRVPDAVPAAYVFAGRHPAVTANSSAEIDGTVTATLLADGPRGERTPAELAAVALHETFHVFQRARHPGWMGNEGDLFLYPTEDARLLAWRRLETEALRRALAGERVEAAACWTRRALGFRRERFAAMDAAFSAYERGTELNEGLASYIQLRAAGKSTLEIPESGFGATEVRHRIYAIGPALALLLDRFRTGWPAALEVDDRQHLDGMLEGAVGGPGADPQGGCGFSAAEVASAERVARQDAEAVAVGRAERRKAFDARPGWRLVVLAAEGKPLWPQGFDPLNVERVEGGLLHTRFLRLGNESGELAAVEGEGADLEALTEGAGTHPLFHGVRRVSVACLAKPEVEAKGGRVTLRNLGLTAAFENASAQVHGTEVLIQIASPP